MSREHVTIRDAAHTLRKSFKEHTPQARLASIPMISLMRMQEGVPRAPNVAAWCSVLDKQTNQTTPRQTCLNKTHAFMRKLASSESLKVPSSWRVRLNMRLNQAQRYLVENLDDILAERPMLGSRLRCFDLSRLLVKVLKTELHLL